MIKQVYVSGGVKFFRQGFKDRWGMGDYNNIRKPAIFIGMYNNTDIEVLKRHKGFKVVWLTGVDRGNAQQVMSVPGVVFCLSKIGLDWFKETMGGVPDQYKVVRLPIKDYSGFEPVPLGKNVYCYVGKGNNKGKFREELIREIAAKSRHPFLFGIQGQSIHRIKKQYYTQSFINIKLNPFAGTTSAYELAHMGRRSVCNRADLWYINWQDVDHVVDIIEEESKKIGMMPECLVPDDHFVGEEWLNVNFWLK